MPPGRTSSSAVCHASVDAGGLDHDVRALARAGLGAEEGRECLPLGPRADADGPAARVGDARAEHQADRAEPDHGDGVARRDAGLLDAVEAARERLDHRRDLGRHPRRDGEEVRAGDALGDEDELGVGAVEEREEVLALGLLAARAGRARAAGGGVGGDDAAAGGDVDAAELVPERARRRPEQHGVAAAERLQVGAVGERDLDLHEHVAVVRRLGPRDVLESQVAGAVEDEGSHACGDRLQPAPGFSAHGTSTTLSAAPSRCSANPSSNRANGSTVGSGTSSVGRSATASAMCAGVAERDPTTVSSRRYTAAAGSVPASAKSSTVPPGSTAASATSAPPGAHSTTASTGPSGSTPARCGMRSTRTPCLRAPRARRRTAVR